LIDLPFELTILGSSSAIPAYGRHHSTQHLRVGNKNYLIDCGEAAQNQLQRFKLKPQRIDAIFISHLHGDHYLGLVGLLSSMHLLGRKRKLDLFGPLGLGNVITLHLKYSDTVLRYPLDFHPLDVETQVQIYEDKYVTVKTIPLKHRVPCTGFLFREKQIEPRLRKQRLPANLSIEQIRKLKKGEDLVNPQGDILYKNRELTMPPRKSRSYAYCSDTVYLPENARLLKSVDILYHEATFMTEKELRASHTLHATAGQAAELAKKAKVNKLLLGHFSARYKDLSPLLREASGIFKNVYLAEEGQVFMPDE